MNVNKDWNGLSWPLIRNCYDYLANDLPAQVRALRMCRQWNGAMKQSLIWKQVALHFCPSVYHRSLAEAGNAGLSQEQVFQLVRRYKATNHRMMNGLSTRREVVIKVDPNQTLDSFVTRNRIIIQHDWSVSVYSTIGELEHAFPPTTPQKALCAVAENGSLLALAYRQSFVNKLVIVYDRSQSPPTICHQYQDQAASEYDCMRFTSPYQLEISGNPLWYTHCFPPGQTACVTQTKTPGYTSIFGDQYDPRLDIGWRHKRDLPTPLTVTYEPTKQTYNLGMVACQEAATSISDGRLLYLTRRLARPRLSSRGRFSEYQSLIIRHPLSTEPLLTRELRESTDQNVKGIVKYTLVDSRLVTCSIKSNEFHVEEEDFAPQPKDDSKREGGKD